MNYSSIIEQLPYSAPFLFVDEILSIDENHIKGCYTFSADHDFYKGHFTNNPVTPGVILTECMGQIGVVCLGIFLLNLEKGNSDDIKIALSSSEIEYLRPVYPEEKVTVVSRKRYFRFNKLKCDIEMFDSENNKVCMGSIAGMILKSNRE